MAYTKHLVDNPTCSRRFHLTFDDTAPKKDRVEIRCQLCQTVIFQASNHPPVTLARMENLVKTAELSDDIVTNCNFEDLLSKKTIPGYEQKDVHLYRK